MIFYRTGNDIVRKWALRTEHNEIVDLTDCTAMFEIRANNQSDVLLTLTPTIDVATGVVTLDESDIEITPGNYVFTAYVTGTVNEIIESSELIVLVGKSEGVTP